jgi:hypothetical protein
VQIAVGYGLKEYRNISNDDDKRESACDAVSQVLSDIGAIFTYENVREIWRKSEQRKSGMPGWFDHT